MKVPMEKAPLMGRGLAADDFDARCQSSGRSVAAGSVTRSGEAQAW